MLGTNHDVHWRDNISSFYLGCYEYNNFDFWFNLDLYRNLIESQQKLSEIIFVEEINVFKIVHHKTIHLEKTLRAC